MASKKTRGLVIAEKPINEADKLITIFSENGKFKAVARGARSPKSKIASASRLFSWSNFVYYPGKNLARISEASLIDPFYSISDDLEKLAYASYCADLLNSFYEEDQIDKTVLKLAVYYFYYLAHSEASASLLTLAFQIKLLAASGMFLNIDSLNNLDYRNKPVYLSVEEGCFLEHFSREKNKYLYKLTPWQTEKLLQLYKEPINEIKNIMLAQKDRKSLEKLIEILNHFIEVNLTARIRSFEVLKQLRDIPSLENE